MANRRRVASYQSILSSLSIAPNTCPVPMIILQMQRLRSFCIFCISLFLWLVHCGDVKSESIGDKVNAKDGVDLQQEDNKLYWYFKTGTDGSITKFMIDDKNSEEENSLQKWSSIEDYLFDMASMHETSHLKYLQQLKSQGFEPKVIYDIGASLLHFTHQAKVFWPNATYVLFEAIPQLESLYTSFDNYNIGVLSNVSNREVKYYFNILHSGGSSYYREVGSYYSKMIFSDDDYLHLLTTTLDDVVSDRSYLPPDLIKMDVQGAELDIMRGGLRALSHAERLIVEIQDCHYNLGASEYDVSMDYILSLNWTLDAPRYTCNYRDCTFDADYGFSKTSCLKSEKNGCSNNNNDINNDINNGNDHDSSSPVAFNIGIDSLLVNIYRNHGMNVTSDEGRYIVVSVDEEDILLPKLGLILAYRFGDNPEFLLDELLDAHNISNDMLPDKDTLLFEIHLYLLRKSFDTTYNLPGV